MDLALGKGLSRRRLLFTVSAASAVPGTETTTKLHTPEPPQL